MLHVDLTDASRKIFRVRATIPVRPGALTLYYPKWIPGEHSPSGPLANVVGVEISGNGQRIAWRRDLIDMYALHLDVPQGVSWIELKFQFPHPAAAMNSGKAFRPRPGWSIWNGARWCFIRPGITRAQSVCDPASSCRPAGNLAARCRPPPRRTARCSSRRWA